MHAPTDRRFVRWNIHRPVHQEIGRALCVFVGTDGDVREEGSRCLVAKYKNGWFQVVEHDGWIDVTTDGNNSFSMTLADEFAEFVSKKWRGDFSRESK